MEKNTSIRSIISYLQYLWGAHITNWLWLSHDERRQRRYICRKASHGRDLRIFLMTLKKEFLQVEPDDCIPEPEPERVFTIWLQGEAAMPPVVKGCIESIRRNTGKEVVVLDAESIGDWIDVPQFIIDMWKNGQMIPAHFSDICRVALLYRHGGYWFDATLLSSGPPPLWMEKADVFLYEVRTIPEWNYARFQNCFIRAKKGNFLMKAWLHAMLTYWRHIGHAEDYMIHQVMLDFLVTNDPRCKAIYNSQPHAEQYPTHRFWWEVGQKPFNEEIWKEIEQGAPFQKTRHADNPFEIPGSFRDVIIRRWLLLASESKDDIMSNPDSASDNG